MYTDTIPPSPPGPSKSYAQAVKEPPSPQTQLPPPRRIEIIPRDDDWTDVSSVTSCGWPGSVDTESVFSDDSSPVDHPVKGEEQAALDVVVKPREDVPWIDEHADTRVPHAFAGQIKHCNRSRWRYTNIHSHPEYCYHVYEEEPAKLWRPFPGCRETYWHRPHGRVRNQSAKERDVKAEVREVKRSLKKSKDLF